MCCQPFTTPDNAGKRREIDHADAQAASIASVHQKLKNEVKAGDVILVKGSRSMRMERTVKFIKEKIS